MPFASSGLTSVVGRHIDMAGAEVRLGTAATAAKVNKVFSKVQQASTAQPPIGMGTSGQERTSALGIVCLLLFVIVTVCWLLVVVISILFSVCWPNPVMIVLLIIVTVCFDCCFFLFVINIYSKTLLNTFSSIFHSVNFDKIIN
jgi:glucan phosphoethanolaminetransferase (alkaline phosphatase superfamily)